MWRVLKSIKTASLLTGILLLLMLYGGFSMPAEEAFNSINNIPLFKWLMETPLYVSWWLWASMAVIVLLVVNTIVCTADAIIRITTKTGLLLRISAQIIHISFCFLMLGHLLSSMGSYHAFFVIPKGGILKLNEYTNIHFKELQYKTSSGYITDIKALLILNEGERIHEKTIAPNRPLFLEGLGLYLKDFTLFPEEKILVELSREPGALWALLGAILFTAGTLSLVLLKLKDRRV